MDIIESAIIQRDGSLPLPAKVAEHLKVGFPDEVTFSIEGDSVVIRKKPKETPLEIKHYLDSGYDLLAAMYLASRRKKLVDVIPHYDYTLTLIYENNEKRKLDCKLLMAEGGLFSHLRNYGSVFVNAKVESNAVCWSLGKGYDNITLDADTCYIRSIPDGIPELTREEMLEAKMASLSMGVELDEEEAVAGFAVSRRILGLSRRGR